MPELSSLENTGPPEHTSESEEMYLITAARAVEQGRNGPIPLAVIAESLGVSVASANEMVRKLGRRDLLAYEPYRGIELTEGGRRIADRVLRIRRLWATFLADHLGLSPGEADDQACHLEHVTTDIAAHRLAEFLGDPQTDPLGHRIPGATAATIGVPSVALTDAGAGETVEVLSVTAVGQAANFVADHGIVPGARVRVVGVGASGVMIDAGGLVGLAGELARSISVRRIEGDDATQ